MLDKYISAHGNSKPVFQLRLNFNNSELTSQIIDEYFPAADANDPIAVLVAYRFSENLMEDRFVTDYENIKTAVYRDIKKELCKFIDNNGGYKNAKQSGIYRFMALYDTSGPLMDGLVYLYRYCKSLGMASTGTFPVATDQKHIDNILAIIELMRSNFEPRTQTHE